MATTAVAAPEPPEHGKTHFEILEEIRARHGGVLRPADVVEEASDEAHPLHSSFCWDDTEAAHEYRLDQARRLIRVVVTTLPQDDKQTIRAYVSPVESRKAGDSYLATVEVLSDTQKRTQLLEQFRREFESFRARWSHLSEAARILDVAARKVERESKKAQRDRAKKGGDDKQARAD